MANTISNTDNVIDSRDVIARVEELEAERQELLDAVADLGRERADAEAEGAEAGFASADVAVTDAEEKLFAWDDSEKANELETLKSLQDELEGYCDDWKYGVTIIRESYFKDYAMEMAEDIGAIKNDAGWPNSCIDWDQAARELQMDYTSAEFDGITYWAR